MILFTHFSLLCVAVFFLLVVGLVEVLRGKGRDRRRTLLLWHLGASILYIACLFLDDAIYGQNVRFFYYLAFPVNLASAIFYGELCYAVAGLEGTQALNRYRWVVGLAIAVWALSFVSIGFFARGSGFDRYAVFLVLHVLLFCWPIILFSRELRKKGISVSSLVALGWSGIRLQDSEKAMAAFLAVTLLRFIGIFPPFLSIVPGVPANLTLGLLFFFSLLVIACMVVVYLAFVEKSANLATRISSLLSATILTVFMVVALTFLSGKPPLRESDAALLRHDAIMITPASDAYHASLVRREAKPSGLVHQVQSPGMAVNVALPFPFRFFGAYYERLAIFPDGKVAPANDALATPPGNSVDRQCRSPGPVIAVFCMPGRHYEIYTGRGQHTFTIAWMRPANDEDTELVMAFWLVLRRDGVMTLNYAAFPEELPVKRAAAIGVRKGPAQGPLSLDLSAIPVASRDGSLWFDLERGSRLMLHSRLYPLAVMVTVVMLLLLFLIRPYITRLIVSPLDLTRAGLPDMEELGQGDQFHVWRQYETGDGADGGRALPGSQDEACQPSQKQLLGSGVGEQGCGQERRQSDAGIPSKDQIFERKLREVIAANLADYDFQVGALADAMALSTRHLHRKVLEATSETPAALIRNLRLEHGHKLLVAKATNVSGAAYRSGFRDVGYFTRLFRKKYGLAPSDMLS